MRNVPEAHRQTLIEIFGEECLRPFGLDEAQEVIAKLGFVCRCRNLVGVNSSRGNGPFGIKASEDAEGQHMLALALP